MRSAAGIVLLSLLVAGCGGGSLFGSSSSSSGGQSGTGDFTGPIADFFATSAGTKPQRSTSEQAPEEVDCPLVAVREGAATLAIHASGEPSAMSLRYQGTIGRTARQCQIVAKTTLQVKLGIEGHIILGPAGGPGKLDVPLRLALVREGPQPVTVLTKTYSIPVTIEPGATNVPFVRIDNDLTFPLPTPVRELESYVIYVGFDPEAKKRPEPRRRRAAPRRRN